VQITISTTVPELDALLDEIATRLAAKLQPGFTELSQQGTQIMATIQEVQAAVARESTVEDSVVALLTQISQQLKDAIAANDPVAMQAVVDQIDQNSQRLADAVTANTPAPPPAPPAP